MMDANPEVARRIHIPTLFLGTPRMSFHRQTKSRLCSRRFGRRAEELLGYTRSYHLLLHDVQREEVTRDVINWLRKQDAPRP